MPKKGGIDTLYYHVFVGKLACNSLKKCDLAQKVLGKSVCDAYLCSMSNRIRAYFRLQRIRKRIRKAECEEWEKFIKEVRMKSLQDRNDKRSAGNNKGYNACPESNRGSL